jgi:hypothetical protein
MTTGGGDSSVGRRLASPTRAEFDYRAVRRTVGNSTAPRQREGPRQGLNPGHG